MARACLGKKIIAFIRWYPVLVSEQCLCRVNAVIPAGTDTEGVREFAAKLPPELQGDFTSDRGMPRLIPR